MKITVTAEININTEEIDEQELINDITDFFCDNEQTYFGDPTIYIKCEK